MTEIERHWNETKELVGKIDSKDIAKWLLEEGYFPEQYIFPPNFKVEKFELRLSPYHKAPHKKGTQKFSPKIIPSEVLNISYPKTELTDRIFGIYAPKAYHDIIWYLEKHWNQIKNHLFSKQNRVFSYSFPIPVSSESIGQLGSLRTGRMIYEYLNLVEKDLLSESYKYKYLLKTDIKNFYPSIYTHSISWAIHSKKKIRDGNESNFGLVGNILDKLVQYANDRKTNGIPIGPAVSDLISEIILAAVDKSFSKLVRKEDFIAARYKDDYFFLIKDDEQVDKILKNLQKCFKEYNLFINEEKTKKYQLPDGLFRPWILRFDKTWIGLVKDENSSIRFKKFLILSQEVLHIDTDYPGTGIIDKFLAKLTDKGNNYALKIDYSGLEQERQSVFRTYSILIHLSKRSKKSFPSALGVIESIIRAPDSLISKHVKLSLIQEMKNLNSELLKMEDEHKKLWWIYFVLTNNQVRDEIDIKPFYKSESLFLRSFKKGKQKFFTELDELILFTSPVEDIDNPISKHLNIFHS